MLTITKSCSFQPEMPLFPFQGMQGDNDIWKKISLHRVPTSERIRIRLNRVPQPMFVPWGELQKKAPPTGGLSTYGCTDPHVELKFNRFLREQEPTGSRPRLPGGEPSESGPTGPRFRISEVEFRVDVTLRIWIDDRYRPIQGDKLGEEDKIKTILYGLVMGHELEHLLDNIDVLNQAITPQRFLETPAIRRFLVDDGPGGRARVSEKELLALFGSELSKIWEADAKLRNRHDSVVEYSNYSTRISAAKQRMLNLIDWPK